MPQNFKVPVDEKNCGWWFSEWLIQGQHHILLQIWLIERFVLFLPQVTETHQMLINSGNPLRISGKAYRNLKCSFNGLKLFLRTSGICISSSVKGHDIIRNWGFEKWVCFNNQIIWVWGERSLLKSTIHMF